VAGVKAAEIFNPKLVIGLIAAAIVAFIALLLLLAYRFRCRRRASKAW
jgi:hypothetical protein